MKEKLRETSPVEKDITSSVSSECKPSNEDAALAISLVQQGDRYIGKSMFREAAESYVLALELNTSLPEISRNLVVSLVRCGELERAWPILRNELAKGKDAIEWAQSQIEHSLNRMDFRFLECFGRMFAYYQWGSVHFRQYGDTSPPAENIPRDFVTVTKLEHDAGQFQYLRELNLLEKQFDTIIAAYLQIAKRLKDRDGVEARTALTGEVRKLIGSVYNRIVYLPYVPRLRRVFSTSWSPKEIEEKFLTQKLGVVVVDDFLTAEALEGVRRCAMQSTVWSGIRYAYGRLGAFLHDGFNSDLLLQIAEELKQSLPSVITDKYPIRQIWAFKNSTDLPPDSNLHADFAAVNVNFWITPNECNLDSNTGGMVVYDVDAPRAWDFHTYNGRTDIIKAFLRENRAQETYIPYRQNRCIIFNSDLFHGTHSVHFKPGFENHRINVTMLYGQREHDEHHGSLSNRPDLQQRWQMQRNAWRSVAFRQRR